MKKATSEPPRRKGRPLSFDRDAALQQAMLLFWQQGYESTSLSDLTSALGVTPPSIYAAFGDKKRLFLNAVERYVGSPSISSTIIANAKSARDAAVALLEASAIGFTGTDSPPGCLLASAAISCSPAAADVQRALAGIRRTVEQQLAARVALDIETGALPCDVDGDALAAHVMSVIQGMSTLARDGAPREKLMRVCKIAMRAWPRRTRRDASQATPIAQ
jgi:AcrR family transcriptional regulator